MAYTESCWRSVLKISGSFCTIHYQHILLICLTFWAMVWLRLYLQDIFVGEKGSFIFFFFSDWKLREAYNVEVGNELLRKRRQKTGSTLIFWFFSCANPPSLFCFKVFWIISVNFGEFWISLPKNINCVYKYQNTLSSLPLLVEYRGKKTPSELGLSGFSSVWTTESFLLQVCIVFLLQVCFLQLPKYL